MSELDKLDLEWIDSSNDIQRQLFLDALNSYLLFKEDSLDKCDLLIEKYPSFNAPKLLKIILTLLARDNHKIQDAKRVFSSINIENLNDHFKKYLIAISFWLKSDLHSVISSLQNIISNHQKDILAIRLLHFNSIFIGIDSNFLTKHQEILGNWSKKDPLYNLILGMTSFAYEENDQLSLAQSLANDSLALSKTDLWSWHALLHVQDNELSSDLESNKYFTSIDWSQYGAIKRHIWWHQALMHFYKKNFVKCLEMFDNFIFSKDEFYLDFCNTSSLLLRLHYQGIDVEQRMHKLKPLANYFCNQHLIPFIDYHLVLFYKYFDDSINLRQIQEGVDQHYKNTQFEKIANTYLEPVIKNLHNGEVIDTKVMHNAFQQLGGSFAQREIILLGLLNHNDQSDLHNTIKKIVGTKKTSVVNYA